MSEDPSSRSLLSQILGAFSGADADRTALPAPERNGSTAGSAGGDLILNVQEFQLKRVEDVMVPRADITAVDITTPLKELTAIFGEAAHSRLPVFRETLDDPVGVAHIKDVVSHLARYAESAGEASEDWSEARILPDIKRPLLYVPASMRALDLLLKMQSRRMHMALVVDEFGGTDGLVTLEDLLEPIVGDIEDEHDIADTVSVRAKGPGLWEADARAEILELEEALGREIATEEEEADVDTLGGLVFRLAGRVPERGEVIVHPSGFEFEVLDSDPRRIKRLRVREAGNGEAARRQEDGDTAQSRSAAAGSRADQA
ncbi:MAG: hemolysin family protein [Alphaproteobacteria bacterium]|nr:hemolysin family protein [Alphaproteobacteria bacterium]